MGVWILNISITNAFYNDTESSNGNIFSAGLLDFQLTNNNLNKIIGPEALGEISHASVAMPESGSLPMQYVLNTSIATTTSNADFCNGLIVEAKDNGITKYLGPLSGLTSATTTNFGTWEFRFDLPPTVSVPHGVKCNASAIFSAWRADTPDPANSGWHDEETLNISFTARMVVLNEIYAHPASGAVAPKNREYVELYNNGSTPVDTLGWQISEIAGSTETFYTIVASTTSNSQMQPFSGSTIIPPNGFLVLVFNTVGAEHFNNDGDTVKLYDNATTLLDSHTYPTVATGKSVVRFPDGIGFWVDPEATPGTTNIVSLEDLRAAGFDDAMIAEVLKLALLKNVSVLETQDVQTNNEQLDVATTTPETLATSTVDTATTTTSTTSETVTLPPFKEEEIVAGENASTTPEVIIEEPAIEPQSLLEAPTDTEVMADKTASEVTPESISGIQSGIQGGTLYEPVIIIETQSDELSPAPTEPTI